ncbi:MAG: hypothetical protein MRJ96_02610 [Nitrospirales bacterium]|nr:hypothetical protein [Nitrospira sp.]MDR4500333.1 hypothetical protein [Nitrospirales bacterium]
MPLDLNRMTIRWTAIIQGCLVVTMAILSMACAFTQTEDVLPGTDGKVLAFGVIKVEQAGPYFRWDWTHVRFLDFVNVQTDHEIREYVDASEDAFVLRLLPGTYRLVRIQVSDGPYRAESYLDATFTVHAESVNYLGTWNFAIDSPRTQRMVKLNIESDQPDWETFQEKIPELRGLPLKIALPQPVSEQSRLFSVNPYPNVRYFKRR